MNDDFKKICEEVGINIDNNLPFEMQMILFILAVFQGKIDIDKIKKICKEYGLDMEKE